MKHSINYKIPIFFILILFGIKIIENIFRLDFSFLGIQPRSAQGLYGILFAPLLHGNYAHLIANVSSLILALFILYNAYPRVANIVFFVGYFFTGIFVWLVGATYSNHIGASGLLYCVLVFLIAIGFFRKDIASISVALIIVIFNSGLLWGIFPLQDGISWESHLSGAILGVFLAYFFRNVDKPEIKKITERTAITPFFEDIDGMTKEKWNTYLVELERERQRLENENFI